MNPFNLPRKIDVSIKKGSSGVWLIKIPFLGIFSEVDDASQIDTVLNDLVMTYFDIPLDLRDKFWYRQPKPAILNTDNELKYNPFVSPDFLSSVVFK